MDQPTPTTNNQFLNKRFDRVYGLLAIIVADEDGTILLKGLSPHFSAINKVPQVTDFDSAFPATFYLASEQVWWSLYTTNIVERKS